MLRKQQQQQHRGARRRRCLWHDMPRSSVREQPLPAPLTCSSWRTSALSLWYRQVIDCHSLSASGWDVTVTAASPPRRARAISTWVYPYETENPPNIWRICSLSCGLGVWHVLRLSHLGQKVHQKRLVTVLPNWLWWGLELNLHKHLPSGVEAMCVDSCTDAINAIVSWFRLTNKLKIAVRSLQLGPILNLRRVGYFCSAALYNFFTPSPGGSGVSGRIAMSVFVCLSAVCTHISAGTTYTSELYRYLLWLCPHLASFQLQYVVYFRFFGWRTSIYTMVGITGTRKGHVGLLKETYHGTAPACLQLLRLKCCCWFVFRWHCDQLHMMVHAFVWLRIKAL